MAQSADAADTHAEAAASLASTAGSPRAVGPSAGVGVGASSGEPVSTSEDIVRWMSQVEGEVCSVKGSVSTVSAKVDGLAASFASLKDVVAAASAQVSHLEIAMQQFIDNQVAQGGPSRQGDDARERLLQKSQLSEDAAAWKKPNSRKHWFVRGRIPPNIGEAPADIQAFVGEGVHVTARVAAQLRSLSDFDVAQYGPRSHGDFIPDIMIADRLECLRSALVAILTIGLSSDIADDVPCLQRVNTISESFTSAAASLRTHTLCNMGHLSSRAARRVMSDMVNGDLRLWVKPAYARCSAGEAS